MDCSKSNDEIEQNYKLFNEVLELILNQKNYQINKLYLKVNFHSSKCEKKYLTAVKGLQYVKISFLGPRNVSKLHLL